MRIRNLKNQQNINYFKHIKNEEKKNTKNVHHTIEFIINKL